MPSLLQPLRDCRKQSASVIRAFQAGPCGRRTGYSVRTQLLCRFCTPWLRTACEGCQVTGEVVRNVAGHEDRHPSNMDPFGSSTEDSGSPASSRPTQLDRHTKPDSAASDKATDRLRVVAWSDPLVDHLGYDPRSAYVERFWLGVLGPTTLFLLRSLAGTLDIHPDGIDLDLERTAQQIGLGGRRGRNGPFQRAIGRLVNFELARFTVSRELAVRRLVPPLARRHLMRLDPSSKEQHRLWLMAETPADPAVTRLRWRARRLALGLVAMGDDYATVELELLGWHLHPALASDAASWAWHRSGRMEPEMLRP